MTERNENSAFVPVPETGTVVPTSGPADRSHFNEYDAGLLNDFGGGDVGWWQDYIRAELGRAYDFYTDQCSDRIRELEAALANAEGERDNVKDNWAEARKAWNEAESDLATAMERADHLEAKLREALEDLTPFREPGTVTEQSIWDVVRTVAQSIEQELSNGNA